MNQSFTIHQIRKLENEEFKKLKSSFILMERAGSACAKFILNKFTFSHATILCGPGNNAGDGFIIARLLKKNKKKVSLYCLNKNTYSGDALKAYKKNKLQKKTFKTFNIKKNSLIIDCLFGIGLNRKIKGILKNVILLVNTSDNLVVAIDIASGLNGNSGKVMGAAIKANYSLALHGIKRGQTKSLGKKFSGKVKVIDIGIRS